MVASYIDGHGAVERATSLASLNVSPELRHVFSDSTGTHSYEIVLGNYTWDQALSAAAAQNYHGAVGYLATVTSAAEQQTIQNYLTANPLAVSGIWLGGSDSGVEGQWKWMAGPEVGTQFWNGNANGSAINGAYVNWDLSSAPPQPNTDANAATEDYLWMTVNANWNNLTKFKWGDAPASEKTAYLVEYDTAAPYVNHAHTGSVGIDGAPMQGQTLTATNTLTDADGMGTVSYQWLADGAAIGGGTGSTFTVAQAQVGKAISVAASYTDGHGTVETVFSAATSAATADVVSPTVTLMDAGPINSTGGLLYGFNFSEAVTGFDLTDLNVVNGVASSFTMVDSSHYTAVFTPTSSTSPLNMTVNVGAGAATDTAGNASTAAAQILHSVLWGTSGNDSLTVGTAADTVYLSSGNDTVVMTAATGSTAAATDMVFGFGSGDHLDLKAILGTGGSGYTSTAVADTGAGFVELKNLVLTQGTSTTTVKFDVNFDAATISGSKIAGAVIDLVYDYSKVSAAQVTNTTFVDPTFGTSANVWANVSSNLVSTSSVTANGKIALLADPSISGNPIIDTSGKAFGVTLIVNSLVSTFSIGLESAASGGSTSIITANYVTSNVDVGITKIAGAALGSNGVLQIVADANGVLSTVTDNQFHMATSYDSVNKVTHLLVQYDTNSASGTTALSNVIAMDFDGDVTTTLVPASLTYTFP